MFLKYAEFERLIERMFGLSEDQRPALKSRFKYLKKVGLRPEIGEGRARYDVAFLIYAILVFELIDLGCSPTRAARMISTHWPQLLDNIARAWEDVLEWETGKTGEVQPFLWAILPHVLCEAGRRNETSGPDADAPSLLSVDDRAGDILLDTIAEWSAAGPMHDDRHAIVISLSHLLSATCTSLSGVAPHLVAGFRSGLDAFCELSLSVRAPKRTKAAP